MSTKTMIAILSFLLAVHLASGQVQGQGPCPAVQGVQNFNVKKYMGLWYEFKKYPNFFSMGAKCITATYEIKKDGNVSVFNQQVKNGAEDSILGFARLISSGVLGVSFPTVPFNVESNYIVLDTDYKNYSVVFSCSSSPPRVIDGRYVWLLSRTRVPSQATINAAQAALIRNGISLDQLLDTDQSACPKLQKCKKV